MNVSGTVSHFMGPDHQAIDFYGLPLIAPLKFDFMIHTYPNLDNHGVEITVETEPLTAQHAFQKN